MSIESGNKALVYGSYGYSGLLAVEACLELGLTPLLAGRNAEKLAAQAATTGLEHQVLDLGETQKLEDLLRGVRAVLHCAGPFQFTAAPMLEACLKTGTHYLDITGEIEVFEMLRKRDQEAQDAGIVVLPGTGYDVVPSDCLAVRLQAALPAANLLELAIYGGRGGMSRGTALTVVENLGKGSWKRSGGKLVRSRPADAVIEVDLGKGPRKAASIPWGDVVTAGFSTGIPEIVTHSVLPPKVIRGMRFVGRNGWLFDRKWVRALLRRRVHRRVTGPDKEALENGKSYVWGRVSSPDGSSVTGMFKGYNGYRLTGLAAARSLQLVMEGKVEAGFQTPATAFGWAFAEQFGSITLL